MTMTEQKQMLPTVGEMETNIVRQVVHDALAASYLLSVDNGGDDYEITKSKDAEAVLAELQNTSTDTLIIHDQDGKKIGWIDFVYGNEGWCVIGDYSDNAKISLLLTNANALSDKYSEQGDEQL